MRNHVSIQNNAPPSIASTALLPVLRFMTRLRLSCISNPVANDDPCVARQQTPRKNIKRTDKHLVCCFLWQRVNICAILRHECNTYLDLLYFRLRHALHTSVSIVNEAMTGIDVHLDLEHGPARRHIHPRHRMNSRALEVVRRGVQ